MVSAETKFVGPGFRGNGDLHSKHTWKQGVKGQGERLVGHILLSLCLQMYRGRKQVMLNDESKRLSVFGWRKRGGTCTMHRLSIFHHSIDGRLPDARFLLEAFDYLCLDFPTCVLNP